MYCDRMSQYPVEVKNAARSLYLKRYKIKEIADTLNIPKRTLYHWADVDNWNDLIAYETAEEAIKRRLTLLAEREDKTKTDLVEFDVLISSLERLEKLSYRKRSTEEDAAEEIAEPRQLKGKKREKANAAKKSRTMFPTSRKPTSARSSTRPTFITKRNFTRTKTAATVSCSSLARSARPGTLPRKLLKMHA